jgi:8-oxo-dGTP diphosphatase
VNQLNNTSPSNFVRLADKPLRHVVAALILRGAHPHREVLIGQRRPDQALAHKWEFPGGKIEPGESAEQALARELEEELGIAATVGDAVTTIRHNYRNGGAIQIQFFIVTEFAGEIRNRIFQETRWTPLDRLPGFDFVAADLTLIRELADGKHL